MTIYLLYDAAEKLELQPADYKSVDLPAVYQLFLAIQKQLTTDLSMNLSLLVYPLPHVGHRGCEGSILLNVWQNYGFGHKCFFGDKSVQAIY